MDYLDLMLLIIAILLQIGDGVTTYLVLQKGGKEMNKLLAWLFEKIGTVTGLILVKSAGIAACLLAYFFAGDFALGALIALVIIYTAILINNLRFT